MGVKYTSKCENKEWKEAEGQGFGGFWIYTHRDWQTIGQRQKDSNKADKLLFRSIQCWW